MLPAVYSENSETTLWFLSVQASGPCSGTVYKTLKLISTKIDESFKGDMLWFFTTSL